MRKIIPILIFTLIFTGCAKTAPVPKPGSPVAEEIREEEFVEEDYIDEEYEDYDEYPEEDLYEEDYVPEDEDFVDNEPASVDLSVTGTWYTDGYDEEGNWAMSYKIELTGDGKASCVGYRNKDTGTYEVNGNNVFITFDNCETETPGEGFTPVEGYKYTVNMTVNGDDAEIKVNAPDVISNLEDGIMHKKRGSVSGENNAENIDLKDIYKVNGVDYPEQSLKCYVRLMKDGKPGTTFSGDRFSTVKINGVEYVYASGGYTVINNKGTDVLFITRIDGEDIFLTENDFDIESNETEVGADITLDKVCITDAEGKSSKEMAQQKIKAIVCLYTEVKDPEGFSEIEFSVVPKGEGFVNFSLPKLML